jgi:hypothetical protein
VMMSAGLDSGGRGEGMAKKKDDSDSDCNVSEKKNNSDRRLNCRLQKD